MFWNKVTFGSAATSCSIVLLAFEERGQCSVGLAVPQV